MQGVSNGMGDLFALRLYPQAHLPSFTVRVTVCSRFVRFFGSVGAAQTAILCGGGPTRDKNAPPPDSETRRPTAARSISLSRRDDGLLRFPDNVGPKLTTTRRRSEPANRIVAKLC